MKNIKQLLEKVSENLQGLAKGNAVVAKKISVGNRHVIPLCALSLGFGGGGGTGEGSGGADEKSGGAGKGTGGGVGGAAKAHPVAVIVVDGGKVRVESLAK